jgi:RND family efflux transporter MFP subunit
MTRSRLIGLLIALSVALILGALGLRWLGKSRAPQSAAAPSEVVAELAPTDLVAVAPLDLQLGWPVSGTLRAVNTALVKAKVAGQLQGLRVREGDAVKAGQTLAQIDTTEYRARLEQAQQQADAAKAQVDITQRQLDNNKALVAQNFISQTALQTSVSNLEAANAQYRAALAAADVARKSLDDTVLTAPISGQVSQRLAQPGERLGVDARVLEIVDISQLELEASVSAAQSVQLKLGQSAQLQIEGSAQPVNARLVRINPSAQAASRSVLAYLIIDNKAGSGLRQGLFAQGSLGTGSTRVSAVPLSSVRTDQAAPYVQLLREGRVVHQPVQLGARGTVGDEVMVGVDLPPGTQVLRASVGLLRQGLATRLTDIAAGAPKR